MPPYNRAARERSCASCQSRRRHAGPSMTRILLVRLSSLGDIVHTFPAVTDIARHVPGATIHWAVDESFAELPALHPAVAKVIPVALRRWRRGAFRPGAWRELAALRRILREAPYDTILDLQGLLKSAVVARLARGPRHGHAAKTAREAGTFSRSTASSAVSRTGRRTRPR